ncbi:hypothetical protein ABZP36_007702 [Zizania latifolia]
MESLPLAHYRTRTRSARKSVAANTTKPSVAPDVPLSSRALPKGVAARSLVARLVALAFAVAVAVAVRLVVSRSERFFASRPRWGEFGRRAPRACARDAFGHVHRYM